MDRCHHFGRIPIQLDELHRFLVQHRARTTAVNVLICLRCLGDLVTEWANASGTAARIVETEKRCR